MKIHSDDETEGSLVNAPTSQPSPKITSPIKEVEVTADEAEWENDGGSLRLVLQLYQNELRVSTRNSFQ